MVSTRYAEILKKKLQLFALCYKVNIVFMLRDDFPMHNRRQAVSGTRGRRQTGEMLKKDGGRLERVQKVMVMVVPAPSSPTPAVISAVVMLAR